MVRLLCPNTGPKMQVGLPSICVFTLRTEDAELAFDNITCSYLPVCKSKMKADTNHL